MIEFPDGSHIAIFDNSTRITLPDGGVILGMPEDTDSYRLTAERCGYGSDTLLLCKEHEATHVALANWLNHRSPTLQHVAHGTDEDMHLRGLEEDAVLAIQKYARAMNVDIIAVLTSSNA